MTGLLQAPQDSKAGKHRGEDPSAALPHLLGRSSRRSLQAGELS